MVIKMDDKDSPNNASAFERVDHVVANTAVETGVVGALVYLHLALSSRETCEQNETKYEIGPLNKREASRAFYIKLLYNKRRQKYYGRRNKTRRPFLNSEVILFALLLKCTIAINNSFKTKVDVDNGKIHKYLCE